jgi:hypothetical protein
MLVFPYIIKQVQNYFCRQISLSYGQAVGFRDFLFLTFLKISCYILFLALHFHYPILCNHIFFCYYFCCFFFNFSHYISVTWWITRQYSYWSLNCLVTVKSNLWSLWYHVMVYLFY